MQLILRDVQHKLFRVWAIFSGIIILLVFLQTVFGRFEGKLLPPWIWVVLVVIPGAALLYRVSHSQQESERQITKNVFQTIQVFTWIYLLLAIGTILAQPFAIDNNEISVVQYLNLSYAWLIPYQGLLLLVISFLFFKKGNPEHIKEAEPAAPPINLPSDLRQECRALVGKHKLKDIFVKLQEHYAQLKQDTPDEIIHLEGRYHAILKDKNQDLVEPQITQRALNKIGSDLLQLLK